MGLVKLFNAIYFLLGYGFQVAGFLIYHIAVRLPNSIAYPLKMFHRYLFVHIPRQSDYSILADQCRKYRRSLDIVDGGEAAADRFYRFCCNLDAQLTTDMDERVWLTGEVGAPCTDKLVPARKEVAKVVLEILNALRQACDMDDEVEQGRWCMAGTEPWEEFKTELHNAKVAAMAILLAYGV